LNIALAMLLVGHLGARGLGIALTLAYTAAAIAAIALLSRRLGGIDFGRFLPAVGRAVALSVVMAVAIAAVEAAFGPMSGLGLLLEVLACVIVAAAVYVGGAGVGSMFGGSGRGRRTGG
jgi:peptidoglycan biosynthesis protein MviN/MurJ (putative lipid II flippase)